MSIDRRDLLKLGGLFALSRVARVPERAAPTPAVSAQSPADYTIRIGTGLVELAPDHILSTPVYNGQFPGPLIRLTEERSAVVDVHNDTDTPEQLHWHGQAVPVDVDGAAEVGTPFIPPHGSRRITFTPGPAGFRFYHSHVRAGADLARGQYGGLVGPVYIEPKHNPGDYDREIFLVLKEFEPTLSRGGDMPMNVFTRSGIVKDLQDAGESAMHASLSSGKPHGFEVGYGSFSINGRMLGHGEPIRVKRGDRILFHVLNGRTHVVSLPPATAHGFWIHGSVRLPLTTCIETHA